MSTTREIDATTLPAHNRHAEIFGAFDGLRAYEAFILVTDHDPKPLLHHFQTERSGHFDWSVLEAGPTRFRVEIRRRAPEGPRNVTEYLEGDHHRLDAILLDVRRLLGQRSFEQAAARFAEFSCGLGRHIDVEEQILFPTFEEMTGMMAGPTVVMRGEHEEIHRAMAEGAEALAAADAAAADHSLTELTHVLAVHNMKEERMLYPMTDRAAGDDRARDELVRRLQAF